MLEEFGSKKLKRGRPLNQTRKVVISLTQNADIKNLLQAFGMHLRDDYSQARIKRTIAHIKFQDTFKFISM